MMRSMFRSGHNGKVGNIVVHRVVVDMVNNGPLRNRPICLRPHMDGQKNPCLRFRDFHPSARFFDTVAAATDPHGSDGHFGIGQPTFLVGSPVFQRHADQRLVLAVAGAKPFPVGQHVAGFAVERLGAMRAVFSGHEGSISPKRSMSIVGAGTSKPHLDAVPWVVVAERVIVARLRQQRLFGAG